MEKQRVNDAVVKLGNLIIKARVFVAHRLSSKIRALRKKGDGKLERRIERLILEISYLKTLSKSGTRKAVARKMLLSTEDHAAKIQRESTSPEDRAFSRLCKTKFIENFISKFREDNVDWKYWVPPLLAMWDKKVEMKKTRILGPDTDKAKRLSAREVAEATKRKLESGGSEDRANHSKRAKRDNAPLDQQRKRISTPASKGFTVEPMLNSGDHRDCDSEADSEDPVGETTRVASEDEDQSETGSRSESPSRLEKNSDRTVHVGSDDGSSGNPSSPEICQVPFRPYAPKYFVANGGSEDSGSDDYGDGDDADDNQGASEDGNSGDRKVGENHEDGGTGESDSDDGESGDESEESDESGETDDSENEDHAEYSGKIASPPKKKAAHSAISLKQLEKVLDKDKDCEDSDEDEEESSQDDDDEEAADDVNESSDENDSDRERKFEEKIQKKFKLNGKKEAMNIPVQTYEPDSSEEEFPAPSKSNIQRKNENGDGDEDEDRAPSFFLRKGEQPVEVRSRTVPKEKAPGLNRRQRRGHEKQRSFNGPAPDDSEEAELRSNLTFGKDFRPQKTSHHQDRKTGFGGKTVGRQSFGPRGSGGDGSFGERRHQSERRGSLPSRFNKFPAQDGRGGSTKFAGNPEQNPRENRSDSRPRPNAAGRPEWKSRRPSERPDQTERRSFDRRGQSGRRDFNSSSSGGGTQDTTRAVAEEKLHPSWLAKKKLSAALNQPFQGKKIVFDD